MSDESQERVRQMRELLAKSQTAKGDAEQVRHVSADRGGLPSMPTVPFTSV